MPSGAEGECLPRLSWKSRLQTFRPLPLRKEGGHLLIGEDRLTAANKTFILASKTLLSSSKFGQFGRWRSLDNRRLWSDIHRAKRPSLPPMFWKGDHNNDGALCCAPSPSSKLTAKLLFWEKEPEANWCSVGWGRGGGRRPARAV